MINFGPLDIQAVARGEKPACRMAILTSTTCAEACWHAREEICRCSCGGKNHGCLLVAGASQPRRTAKIDGHCYFLAAVGDGAIETAGQINKRQWRAIKKPIETSTGLMQYKYSWRDSDPGAPARVKFATAEQIARWPELTAFRGQRERPALCLEIEVWPKKP